MPTRPSDEAEPVRVRPPTRQPVAVDQRLAGPVAAPYAAGMSRPTALLAVVLSSSLLAGLLPAAAAAQDPATPGSGSTLTQRLQTAIADDAAALGGDAGVLREYVASRIGYEAYEGVLKGAVGAYLTGTANGADQALLLAALLEAAGDGAELRFAVCEPEAELSAGLHDQSALVAEGRLLAIDRLAEFADRIEDEALRAAIDEAAALRQAAKAEAERGALRLSDELFRNGYAAAATQEALIGHVWLQRFDGSGWIDLDTTTPDGSARCEPGSTSADLDGLMDHRLRLRLTAEQREDGYRSETELLAADFTTAELAASRVALLFGEPAGLLEVLDPASEPATYTPLLRIDGQSFEGTPIELPRPAQGIGGGISETVEGLGGLFEELPSGIEEEGLEEEGLEADDAGGLFGDIGADDSGSASELTGLWLDIELLAPDGQVVELRSELLDRIGIAARAAGEADIADLAPLDEAAGDYAALTNLWQIGLLLGEASAAEVAMDDPLDVSSIDSYSAQLDRLLRTFPALRRDMGGHAAGPAVVLAGLTSGLDEAGELASRLVLDALYVPGRAPSDELAAARDAQATLAAESLLAELAGETDAVADDARAVLGRAADAGTPLAYLVPGEAAGAIEASPAALARIGARLDAGYALLVPESPVDIDGVSATAWWSIDPATGVVRDEHENGRSSESVEYAGSTARTLTTMERFRRFGCRIARPLATVSLVLFLGTGAGPTSPLWEPLSEVAGAAQAAQEAEAARKGAERAACAL